MLRRGFAWLAIYLTVLVVPLAVMAAGDTPARQAFLVELSVALGFLGFMLIVLQFLVAARIGALTRPFGMDVVLKFHRQAGLLALLLVVAHPVLLAVEWTTFDLFNPAVMGWTGRAGQLAIVLLVVLTVLSVWRLQFRLSYEVWNVSHTVLALLVAGFGLWHLLAAGSYTDAPWKAWLWAALFATAVLLVGYTRLLRPLLLLRKPYRLVEKRRERGDSWSLDLEPDGHDGMDFLPGQFAWLTLGTSPFTTGEHPFTVSEVPGFPGRLRFTIKELGDFTGRIGRHPIGTRAYVDGPYGAFTFHRFPAPGYVFIAGGIGVTPMMAQLRSLAAKRDRRPLLLINANQTAGDITFKSEYEALQRDLDLEVVQVLAEPPEDWAGETGFVTAELLDRRLPADRRHLQYFVCGPPAMITAVRGALEELGIPGRRIQVEEFGIV